MRRRFDFMSKNRGRGPRKKVLFHDARGALVGDVFGGIGEEGEEGRDQAACTLTTFTGGLTRMDWIAAIEDDSDEEPEEDY
jgi:hypothetical protein